VGPLAALLVLLRWTAVLGVLVGGFSCAISRPIAMPAPERGATDTFDAARVLLRELDGVDPEDWQRARTLRARAEVLLEQAAERDPTWAPPRRFLDDLARRFLGGPSAYAQRLGAVAAQPGDAVAIYLVGRLEIDRPSQRFAQALAADPSLSWAHHGLSVEHESAQRSGPAFASASRALERARGGYEVSLFARRLSDLLFASGRGANAREVLERAAVRSDLAPLDALELDLALAILELRAEKDAATVERGYRRALRLISTGELNRGEMARLLLRLDAGRAGRSPEAWTFDLRVAIDSAGGAPWLDLASLELLRDDLVFLAYGLLELDGGFETASSVRIAGFNRGAARAAVDAWLAALPAVVRDADGNPKDPALAALVRASRAVPEQLAQAEPGVLLAFADACLRAGWFDEALSLARALHAVGATVVDVHRVESAARAGRAMVGEITSALTSFQGGERSWWFEPNPARASFDDNFEDRRRVHARGQSARDLRGLLDGLANIARTYGAPLGLAEPDLGARIRSSPHIRYGPFARVLVPGPIFARRDAQQGLGEAGSTVPGLAELLHALGRVALVGDVVGSAPDGTLLRRLHHERVEGEHLGVPFEGVVIWCEGTDVAGGLARLGSLVSGAALHEGYWVDIESERRRHARWLGLERQYLLAERRGELEALLAEPGLPLFGDPAESDLARLERRRVVPPLGAGDRLRLAILLERALAEESATEREVSLVEVVAAPRTGRVRIEELIEVIRVHEEGHLIDRTRYLPLGRNPLRALGLALRKGFAPGAIERELERRAQLVALCALPDPRFALVDLLDAAEQSRASAGAHARAYTQLLGELLLEIDREIERDPDTLPALDRERTFVHQLHRLTPEELRGLALEMARRQGVAAN